MSKHDLENMIFNLDQRKDLKKVEFTQKAVIELLGYLKQLANLEVKLADIQNEKDELTHWKGECVKNAQYILELKQQLADSESKSYTLESYNNFLLDQCKKLIKENKQLTHQQEDKGE